MNLKKKKQKTGKRIDRKLYHSLMDPIGIYWDVDLSYNLVRPNDWGAPGLNFNPFSAWIQGEKCRTHNVAGRTLLDESELDNLYKAGFLIVAGAWPYEWLWPNSI